MSHPAFTPQPRSITIHRTLDVILIFGHANGSWRSWPGWLVFCPPEDGYPSLASQYQPGSTYDFVDAPNAATATPNHHSLLSSGYRPRHHFVKLTYLLTPVSQFMGD